MTKPFENAGVTPDPMENMIPVTVKKIEFIRHVEEIGNIGRIVHHNVETNCIVTLAELVTNFATGQVPETVKAPKEIVIVGRSICHDIDNLDEIEQELAYADALNKIHMLGFKIDEDSTIAGIPDEDLATGGNIYEEAEQNQDMTPPEVEIQQYPDPTPVIEELEKEIAELEDQLDDGEEQA